MDVWDLHDNGIHTMCSKPTKPTGGAVNIRPRLHDGGTPTTCMRAGTVEAMHSHDFEGPLWQAGCGCLELATD